MARIGRGLRRRREGLDTVSLERRSMLAVFPLVLFTGGKEW